MFNTWLGFVNLDTTFRDLNRYDFSCCHLSHTHPFLSLYCENGSDCMCHGHLRVKLRRRRPFRHWRRLSVSYVLAFSVLFSNIRRVQFIKLVDV